MDIKKNKIVNFIGTSKFAMDINNIIETISTKNASVLLLGEYGTGKKLFAQHVHLKNNENFKTFFEVNCRAMDLKNIVDIFSKILNITEKSRVTIFISYINLLSKEIQGILLEQIKALKIHSVDFQIICSSQENIEQKVESGTFDSQLFYLINNIVLQFLPLRQRKEDILLIAQYYLNKFKRDSGNNFIGFSQKAIEALQNYSWDGNCEELINAIQRAFIVNQKEGEKLIEPSDLGLGNPYCDLEDKSLKNALDTFKRNYLIQLLEDNNWNQTKVSKILGIQRTYVIKLINELHIRKNSNI